VAFAPNGHRVAAAAADGSVLVWKVGDTGEPGVLVARLAGGETPASCLRWSTLGDRLAIAFSEWSNRDSSSLVIWQPAEDVVDGELRFDFSIGAVDWLSHDEIVVADWNGEAKSIDIESGMSVGRQQLSKDTVSAAAFSPDCPLLPRWQTGRLALGNE
jgi:WD40 repeat protein